MKYAYVYIFYVNVCNLNIFLNFEPFFSKPFTSKSNCQELVPEYILFVVLGIIDHL